MVEIGAATKSDSAAMKTVAVVTMAFLPATFTSVSLNSPGCTGYANNLQAVFSMSFFNFSPGNGTEPDEWKVSSQIWIYWVVAIPLTLMTLLAWLFWKRKRDQKLKFGKSWENRVHRYHNRPDEKA
jgi:ABC-type branched-subunit amino acid transport system permease subunit